MPFDLFAFITERLAADAGLIPFAVVAILLIGVSKGGLGGGLMLLGLALMTLRMEPLKAAAILLPILVVMDITGLIAYRRTFDRRTLTILLPFAVLGIVAGWAVAAYMSGAAIRLLIGVVALLFALDYWRKNHADRERARAHEPVKGAFCGAAAGFTSFLAHAGAPPFQLYTYPLRLEPRLLAGTSVWFFTTVNAIKLMPYAALGQFDGSNLGLSLILAPLAPLGVLLGVWLVRRIPKGPFYTFSYAMVFLVGLKLIYDGAMALLQAPG